MDPLTLKVLATLVQLHGTDAAVGSDNKGIDELLIPVRAQINGTSTGAVNAAKHHETFHKETHSKWLNAKPPKHKPPA
jgi:hypothetical protein